MYAPTTLVKRSASVPRNVNRPASTRVRAADTELRTEPPLNTGTLRVAAPVTCWFGLGMPAPPLDPLPERSRL